MMPRLTSWTPPSRIMAQISDAQPQAMGEPRQCAVTTAARPSMAPTLTAMPRRNTQVSGASQASLLIAWLERGRPAVARPPSRPGRVVGHAARPRRDQGIQSARSGPPGQRDESVHHRAVEQAEVAGIRGDVNARGAAGAAIGARADALPPGIAASSADPVDHVMAVAPARDELRQHRGRILEVRIHRHHRIAARVAKTDHERGLLAGVAHEPDQAQVAMRVHERSPGRGSAIAGAVIDQDEVPCHLQAIELGRDRSVECDQALRSS